MKNIDEKVKKEKLPLLPGQKKMMSFLIFGIIIIALAGIIIPALI